MTTPKLYTKRKLKKRTFPRKCDPSLHEAKKVLCNELALLKYRAGHLGLYKTMHALNAATDAVGWEVADHLEATTRWFMKAQP